MSFAHVAGMPVEEWMLPLVMTGGGIAVALQVAFRRLRRHP
ncbi:MAG: hypothetical protein ABJC79_11230 [Acidimicrobiia bacterium]